MRAALCFWVMILGDLVSVHLRAQPEGEARFLLNIQRTVAQKDQIYYKLHTVTNGQYANKTKETK